MDEFHRKRIEAQLARLRQAEQKTRSIEINRDILTRAASQASIADLSLGGLAEAISEALNSQRREILEHVHRLFKLAQSKASAGHDDGRGRAMDKHLHRRLVMLEAEVRQLRKKGIAS